MTLQPPSYFEEIRRRASDRWKQLAADEELAGPWRLLFQQVQSPRHVVSELLQNADDAGARIVRVALEDGSFVFEHDGRDFSEVEFQSLCRFGFSNKRNLHTIGFRGIGFKSSFSLGSAVEVRTPTIAVRFHSDRFTEPEWMPNGHPMDRTQVRVPLSVDSDPTIELRRSLDNWRESCASLLFFRNVRTLDLEGEALGRHSLGPGPVPNSEWIRLTSRPKDKVLVVRSQPEAFPQSTIDEIKKERNTKEIDLPPCEVELVLGLHGEERLFVVLPTAVRPPLPFSCNAPFLQDPSRFSIKSPALSPTNQWLLRRLGKLAAQTMLTWLGNERLTLEVRASAYDLLPPANAPTEATVDNLAADIVIQAFREEIVWQPCVLTPDGTLVGAGAALSLPSALHEVWPPESLGSLFGKNGEAVVATEVSDGARHRLDTWKLARQIRTDAVYDQFLNAYMPRPESLESLAKLWAFLEPECRIFGRGPTRRKLKIVPVAGSTHLRSAEIVVRLPGRTALPRQEDWDFLARLVNLIESRWLSYLGSEKDNEELGATIAAAFSLLQLIGLDQATPMPQLVDEANRKLFSHPATTLADAIHLAHIVAATDSEVPENFNYATQDGEFRSAEVGIVADPDGSVELLVSPEWAQEHILHSDYYAPSPTCSAQKWRDWVRSSKSRLLANPPLEEKATDLYGESQLQRFLAKHDVEPPDEFRYASRNSQVHDFDFDPELIKAWSHRERHDPAIWSQLAALLLDAPQEIWIDSLWATVYEVSSNGSARPARCGKFPAAWVQRLASKRCLPDTYGNLHEPAALLMRTPETEPLMGAELFVKSEFDNEQTKPLLRILGVRHSAAGIDQLLNRIRALSTVPNPPLHEVLRWYDALDKVLVRADTPELTQARAAFRTDRLILTSELEWATSTEAFLAADEESVPGAPTVHDAARHLSLWPRVGVEDRPSLDRILVWLNDLESGKTLDASELRRVRAVMSRYPKQVWSGCYHWLSLDGTWSPVDQLAFRLSMQGLTKFSDLFPACKAKVADLRNLDAVTCEEQPFAALRRLDSAIEYRVVDKRVGKSSSQPKSWVIALGTMLKRVVLNDEAQQERTRALGQRLRETSIAPVQSLKVTPYIDGTPAGQPASADTLWHERVLFLQDRPFSRLFNAVVHELSRPFSVPPVADAIRACVERSDEFIEAYFEENFELEELPSVEPATEQTDHEAEPAAETSAPLASEEPPETAIDAERATEHPSAPTEPSPADPTSPELIDDSAVQAPAESETALPEETESLLALPAPAPAPKPAREPTQSLFERFAKAQGFAYESNGGKFVHPSGEWMVRHFGGFNYERYTARGEIVCRYWVSEQCLEKGGVEIASDLWELIRKQPEISAMVLADSEDAPLLLSGSDLNERVADYTIRVFPAKYRLRSELD